MTRSLLTIVVLALTLPLAAQPPSEHSDHVQQGQQTQPTQGPQTQGMHEHMQAMQQQMARIHAAQDPAERQRLMHEHMQSMQQHMTMMGRMATGPSDGAAARCAQGDMPCRMGELQAQHDMMQQRMQEMQQLMGQMMQHLSERAADDERGARRR